jgi:Protein of unknown function, DUF547
MIPRRPPRVLAAAVVAGAAIASVVTLGAQYPPPSTVDALHRPYDQILDTNVRDGLIYYRALKGSRGALDRYVGSLDVPTAEYDAWPKAKQIAFWLNAYNAFVIESVLDAYPIAGRSPAYPANSLRQVPGVFEKQVRRVAGRRLTLDDIEKSVLAGFGDPRLFLALGRGSLGGGRLRSSAFSSDTLDGDLVKVAAECVTRHECASIDASGQVLSVTAVFSWREGEFVKAFGNDPLPAYPGRSPLERAILHVLAPHFLPGERQTLAKNDFAVRFTPFDWQLNDLTGGRPR